MDRCAGEPGEKSYQSVEAGVIGRGDWDIRIIARWQRALFENQTSDQSMVNRIDPSRRGNIAHHGKAHKKRHKEDGNECKIGGLAEVFQLFQPCLSAPRPDLDPEVNQ